MSERFGEVVRDARMKKEISLRKVADSLGVTASYVSDIERGNRNPPSLDKIQLWAAVLGLSPEPLVEAAMRERSSFELPLNGDIERNELAIALAREWPHLTGSRRNELLDVLNRKE